MSRGINKVILVANATADAEARTTSNGNTITSVRLATNESWKDKTTGETQERTEYHRVKFFGRLAEIAADYIRKGQQVYIEGSLRTDKYTDKEGVERYTTDIIANEMQLLGGRPGAREEGQGGGAPRAAQAQPQRGGGGGGRGPGAPASSRTSRHAPVPAGDFDDHDSDDIPFARCNGVL